MSKHVDQLVRNALNALREAQLVRSASELVVGHCMDDLVCAAWCEIRCCHKWRAREAKVKISFAYSLFLFASFFFSSLFFLLDYCSAFLSRTHALKRIVDFNDSP